MKATKEIGEVISRVQTETQDEVKSTEAGTREAAEAMDMADRASDALKKNVESVDQTGQIRNKITQATAEQIQGSREVMKYVDTMKVSSDQVNRAMAEQATGGRQVRGSVENMNKLTQQVAKAVREQAAGGRQIRIAVENMNRIMQEVSQAAREQASGSKQIVSSVENMNRMTQQVTVATSEQKRGGDLVVESIYFGGVTATGGARILKAAVQAGLGDIPFVGPDGISDGSAETADSFLNLAGADAKNSYSTLAGIGDFPGKAAFDEAYKKEYGIDPTGYAGTGYACMQVVLDAIARASETNPGDKAAAREAVRAAGTDTTVTYDTILGEVMFDANGDTNQRIISIYKFDPAGANGKGDWAFATQIDFK